LAVLYVRSVAPDGQADILQVELGLNAHQKEDGRVNDGTYVGFIILTFLGACLACALVDAKDVVRRDGSRVILMQHPTVKSEVLALWQTLRNDTYILLLFPMFFSSNWFYTYQFNDVNLARFTVRARALNSTLYWIAQMVGAGIFGFALDFPRVKRTTRAIGGWIAMFALTMIVWGGGYAFQKQYTRADVKNGLLKYDWKTEGFVGPMFLYVFYGFYDAAWQTCVYW